MLQRFTESARRVVTHAQEAALQVGDSSVGMEHVLLGLLREPECGAVRLLVLLGVGPDQLRSVLQQHQEQSRDRAVRDTSSGQRLVELAYQESRRLGSPLIDTEHLLLALIRERHGIAGRVLAELGLELEAVRDAVLHPPTEPLPSRVAPATSESGFSVALHEVLDFAQQEAAQAGKTEVTPEHLLLALLRDSNGTPAQLLRTCNLSLEQLREVLDLPMVPSAVPSSEGYPLTLASQSVLTLAQEEARLLDSTTIETEHLLLGLLRDSKSVIAHVLSWLGIEYEPIRRAIRPLPPPQTTPDPWKVKQIRELGQQILRLAPELAQASPDAFHAAVLGTSVPERVT